MVRFRLASKVVIGWIDHIVLSAGGSCPCPPCPTLTDSIIHFLCLSNRRHQSSLNQWWKPMNIMDSPYTHTGTHKLFMRSQTLNVKHAWMLDDLLVAWGQKQERGRASLFLPITKYLSVKDSRLRSVQLHLEHLHTSYIHYAVTMMHQLAPQTHPFNTHISLYAHRCRLIHAEFFYFVADVV